MPVYEYRCTACCHRSTVTHSMDDSLVGEDCLLRDDGCEGTLVKDYRSVRIPGFIGRHAIGLNRSPGFQRIFEEGKLEDEP